MGGQRAGDDLHRLGDAGIDRSAEPGETVGNGDPVEPVLDVAVFVADVDIAVAVRILADPWRLEQHAFERAVGPAWLDVERLAVEAVGAGAERRIDRIAGIVEPPGGDDDGVARGGIVGFGWRRRGLGKCGDRQDERQGGGS